ncbi:MAG: bifunctional DNA-formamidopyrimidine glycosylase/DNA-(apurinic or apyrimidinic site) lyase, partial [Bdellovibrionaceae bacterium]|nr:bifunctional DNA-formamidopyrimidine glycosylase/DNA-(apurinic or apyrimidinic site) lyase [Pseudobdellovibrionaceae bacterium]
MQTRLPGQSVLSLRRRAKFLLFETEDFVLLNHLGMTGSWRIHHGEIEPRKHDHVILHFESGLKFVFNDPRRFGLLELISKDKLAGNRWLMHLGVEPLSDEFTQDLLFGRTRKRKGPIKGFLMDQKNVVGVGNIYASEVLFKAGVKPLRPAGRLSKAESAKLVLCIREILEKAIVAGGSTISTYRNSKGESGNFQAEFSVYDRKGRALRGLRDADRSRWIAGRNTFWCANASVGQASAGLNSSIENNRIRTTAGLLTLTGVAHLCKERKRCAVIAEQVVRNSDRR